MSLLSKTTSWLKRAWIWSYNGRKLSLYDFNVFDVDIEEIAHALSMTCRFGGHCSQFYSVAEHSLIMSELVEEQLSGRFGAGDDWKKVALAALLHDAPEYILTDVPKPFKQLINNYEEIEDVIANVIDERFGVNTALPIIKRLDKDLVVSEALALFKITPEWIQDHPGEPIEDFANNYLCNYDWEAAKFAFLERYHELTKQS